MSAPSSAPNPWRFNACIIHRILINLGTLFCIVTAPDMCWLIAEPFLNGSPEREPGGWERTVHFMAHSLVFQYTNSFRSVDVLISLFSGTHCPICHVPYTCHVQQVQYRKHFMQVIDDLHLSVVGYIGFASGHIGVRCWCAWYCG